MKTKSDYYRNPNLPPLHVIVAEVFTPEILEEPKEQAASGRTRLPATPAPKGGHRRG